jgi:hypothetical protein
MTFALDLAKFAEKAGAMADQAVGQIIASVASEIDHRSPVGDATYWKSKPPKGYIGGHFRANWQLGIGTLPHGVKAGVDMSGATLAGIIAEIPTEAAGKVYWLANNTPYATRLEHGWSRQAPQGMVGLTATKFQQIVRAAVESVKS